MWNYCGMARNKEGLLEAVDKIKKLKQDFWENICVPGKSNIINPELEKAGRVADFIELGELMIYDALNREESCGGHFREEHQTSDGEARRDDNNFSFVSAWEYIDKETKQKLNKEKLTFDEVNLTQRSYK